MKTILSLVFCFVSLYSAQKYGDIWYFGKNAGMDFSNCKRFFGH